MTPEEMDAEVAAVWAASEKRVGTVEECSEWTGAHFACSTHR
jgi:hypothetical protein